MKDAFVSTSPENLEIEKVLVLEVFTNKLQDLRSAVENIGVEWLEEIEEDDLEIEEDSDLLKKVGISEAFFKTQKVVEGKESSKKLFKVLKEKDFLLADYKGSSSFHWDNSKNPQDFKGFIPREFKSKEPEIINSLSEKIKNKKVSEAKGRLFLFMSNQKGHIGILNLWKKYKENKPLNAKWRDLFNCLSKIRFWNENDRLNESNIIDKLKEDVEVSSSSISFELEFWYRIDAQKRRESETQIKDIVKKNSGNEKEVRFYEKDEAHIHLAKVNLPVTEVKKALEGNFNDLFKNDRVKFFRPEGQSILIGQSENVSEADQEIKKSFQQKCGDKPPIIALLDGLPLENHEALKERLIVDDPDSFGENYPVKSRRHGTSMASLICHGDLEEPKRPLSQKIYVRPILKKHEVFDEEKIPQSIFFEDIIERAVRRMFEGEGGEPVSPSVRVINLSVCHESRWFYKNITSGGRLLDWLSWKYKVVFCVSTGNFIEDILAPEKNLPKEAMVNHTVNRIIADSRLRRLLMPSDSLNAITVGSLHQDKVKDFNIGNRVDILPSEISLLSPISSFGHGFKNSIKPEILLPGGRQLYDKTKIKIESKYYYKTNTTSLAPGQKIATASSPPINKYIYDRGTSNATALASRNMGLISEMLDENNFNIPDENEAVVLKTLLVHGAKWGTAQETLSRYSTEKKLDKKELARYLGFGSPDVERVMSCTEKRVTALGFGKIKKDTKHIFELPLPASIKESDKIRTLVITLSWLTPISLFSSKYKVAKLAFKPPVEEEPLYLKRKEVDSRQAVKGTVQHEVLSAKKQIQDFSDGEKIIIPIECKEGAMGLNEEIPYALAVTLETEEDINIYTEIKQAIEERVTVSP